MKSLISILILAFAFFLAACMPSPVMAETTISWDAPSDGGTVENYTLYFSDDGGATYSYYTTVDASVTSILISDLKLLPGVTYYFKVVASNDAGEGEASNIITYTPEAYDPPTDQLPAGMTAPGAVTIAAE